MLPRSHRQVVATVLLAALLFAQGAIAMAACDMPNRAPAQAFAEEPAMPCHEVPVESRNVCLAHCLSADQTADTPQVVLPAWINTSPLLVALPAAEAVQRVVVLRRVPVQSAAPPPRILFQSFLI